MAEPAWTHPPFTTRTHAINPDTGEFTRLDQESDTMTDLPRTVITLTGDRGPMHVAKGVLVNGSPVAVAEHGVDIDFGPDEVTTVTLRLLADEVHFVKPERAEAKVAPFDPDVIAANLAAIKHELETPMRGHGECCEPADITEEPPVGSQITDNDGEVWGRFEEGWQVWDALGHMEWSGVSAPWSVVRSFAPLRPTTDADRERVGLPVDPAPADVDPDEALARVLWDAFWTGTDCDAKWEVNDERPDWLRVARAAREHIAQEAKRWMAGDEP